MTPRLVLLILPLAVLGMLYQTYADAFAESMQIVTELGNSFTVNPQHQQSATNTTIGSITGKIRVVEPQGKVFHGRSSVGTESSLVPYVAVDPDANYAAVIKDSDTPISMHVAEFAKEYTYDPQLSTLKQVQKTIPNILSYSDSKVLSGTGSITHGPSGISFEGPQKFVHQHDTRWWWKKIPHLHNVDVMAVKLDTKTLADTKALLRGTIQGDYIKIVESPTDLTTLSYDTKKGYKILDTAKSPQAKKVIDGYWHIHGKCCKGRHWHDQSYWVYSVSTDIWASSKDAVSGNYHWPKFCANYYRWGCAHWSGPGTIPLEIHGTKKGDFFHITKLSFEVGTPSKINNGKGGTWQVFDKKGPFNTIQTFEKDFETTFTFESSHPMYLVAQPDGVSTIKAEKFDPDHGTWFKVSGLPADVPFQLEKNGLVGARGVTSSDGNLVLTASSFDIGTIHGKGGILKMFSESATFRGELQQLTVFDTVNGHIIHTDIQTKDNTKTVYTPFAYLQVPISTDTTIEKVTVRGKHHDIHIDYLAAEYEAGSKLDIPILPGMTEAVIKSQGTDNIISLQDAVREISAKAIPSKKSSSTKYSADGALSSIDAETAGGIFAIATGTGQMYSLVTLSVSGDSAFSNDVTLYFVPDPPPPPEPQDPLSIYVDVYKNGMLAKSKRIYYDDKPLFEPVSELNGLKLKQAITYHYNQRTATSMVTVDVNPGDMVEFYARAHIHADGIPVNIPQSPDGTYTVDKTVSAASATARIHSGSILTGMS